MKPRVLELILRYGAFLVKGDLTADETRINLRNLYSALQLAGEENKAIRKEFVSYFEKFLSTKRLYELNKFYVVIEQQHNDQQFYRNPNIAKELLGILVKRVAVQQTNELVIPDLIKKLYKEAVIAALNKIYPKTGQEHINQIVNHVAFCTLGQSSIVNRYNLVLPKTDRPEAILEAEAANLRLEKIKMTEEAKAKTLYDSIVNFDDEQLISEEAEVFSLEVSRKNIPVFDAELEKEFVDCIAKASVVLIKIKSDEIVYIKNKTDIALNKNLFSGMWNSFKSKVFDHGKLGQQDFHQLREQVQSIPSLIENLNDISENQLSAYFAIFIVLNQLLTQLIHKIEESYFENELEQPMVIACKTVQDIFTNQQKRWREDFKELIKYGIVNDSPSDAFLKELIGKIETKRQLIEAASLASNTNQIETAPTIPFSSEDSKKLNRSISEKKIAGTDKTAENFRVKGTADGYVSPNTLKRAPSLRTIPNKPVDFTEPNNTNNVNTFSNAPNIQDSQLEKVNQLPNEQTEINQTSKHKSSAEEFRKSGMPGMYIAPGQFSSFKKGSIKPSAIKESNRMSTTLSLTTANTSLQPILNTDKNLPKTTEIDSAIYPSEKAKVVEAEIAALNQHSQPNLPEIFKPVLQTNPQTVVESSKSTTSVLPEEELTQANSIISDAGVKAPSL